MRVGRLLVRRQPRAGLALPVRERKDVQPTRLTEPAPRPRRWVTFAWWVYGLAVTGLVIAGIPGALEQRMTPCAGEVCELRWWKLTLEQAAAMEAAGISLTFYAYWTQFTSLLVPLWGFAIFGLTVMRKRENRVAHLMALVFLSCNAYYPGSLGALATTQPWVGWVNAGLAFVTVGLMPLLFFVFPTGRFVPRWSRHLVPLVLVAAVPFALLMSPLPLAGAQQLLPALAVWNLTIMLMTSGFFIRNLSVCGCRSVRQYR